MLLPPAHIALRLADLNKNASASMQSCLQVADLTSHASATMQIAYNIDIVKTNVPEALEILSDAVLNPRYTPWEVAEQIVKMEQDIKGLKENPQTVLLEVSLWKSHRQQQSVICFASHLACCLPFTCPQVGKNAAATPRVSIFPVPSETEMPLH